MPQGHLQWATNPTDSDLEPEAAIDVPRFRFLEEHEVALETMRLPEETVTELRGCGHDVVFEEEYYVPDAEHFEGAQLIYRTEDGTLIGGPEPRRDVQAIRF